MTRSAALVLFFLFAASICGFGQTVPAKPALQWAASEGLEQIVSLLIEQGVKVDGVDWFGNTALHAAIRYPRVVELLLEGGASVNARNAFGNTPLHLAVADHRVVDILLAAGADVNARNYLDKTALDYAMRGGRSAYNLSIVETLIRAGAGTP